MNKHLLLSHKRRAYWKTTSAILLAILAEVVATLMAQAIWMPQSYSDGRLEGIVSCHTIILFDVAGKTLRDALEVNLKIQNSGQHPIDESSYKQPLFLDFESQTKVIYVSLLESQPKLVRPSYEIGSLTEYGFSSKSGSNTVQFQPVLLNANDFFQYRIIVDKRDRSFALLGHIVAVKLETKVDSSCQPT